MPTKEELIKKFETKSNAELVELHFLRGQYTAEAVEAMQAVFERRGGINSLMEEHYKQEEKEGEALRVGTEIHKMMKNKRSESEILSGIKSDLLSEKEIEGIFHRKKTGQEEEKKDLHVNERTWVMGALGILTGGTVSGFILAVQIIYTGKIMHLLVALSAVIPYFTIKGFTGQSQKNVAVAIMIIIAFVYAIVLCGMICSFAGINLL